jgi:hypothetical protein
VDSGLRTSVGEADATPQGDMDAEHASAGDQASAGRDEKDQRALQLVLAEFQFVSGLIPLYRGVETTALGGTGLVVSGIVAALAALESSDTPKAAAEGVLLSAGAWAPVVLLLIEIMALTRVARASAYIADYLHPLARELTGDDRVLQWELGPTKPLMARIGRARKVMTAPSSTALGETLDRSRKALVKDRVVRLSASSTPLIITIALVAIVLAVAGAFIYPDALTIISGVLAVLAAATGAAYGIAFSNHHECRNLDDDVSDNQRQPGLAQEGAASTPGD